jgi:hypothetical protein
MYAKKLNLENKIYFRAACLGVTVQGVRGVLRALSDDKYLRALIRVYNQFFGKENQVGLPISDGGYQSFKKQQTYLPILARPKGTPLYACDFPSECAYWQAAGK